MKHIKIFLINVFIILLYDISVDAQITSRSFDKTKSYEENRSIWLEQDHLMIRRVKLNGLRINDLSNGIYYTSTNQTDFVKLSAIDNSTLVSNAICELNHIHKEHYILKNSNSNIYQTTTTPYVHIKQSRRLQNELFDLGAIPVLTSNVWMNGSVLATNNFIVSNDVFERVLMLNWFERNENPLSLEMFASNGVKQIMSKNIDETHKNIYENGYRIHFDRRFNLWRIVGKTEFEKPDDMENTPE